MILILFQIYGHVDPSLPRIVDFGIVVGISKLAFDLFVGAGRKLPAKIDATSIGDICSCEMVRAQEC